MRFDVGFRNFRPFRRIGDRAILANNDFSVSFGSEIKSKFHGPPSENDWMPARTPIPLKPLRIGTSGSEFDEILTWPFDDGFVARLLSSDIPQRALLGNCRIWVYHDSDGVCVGFGILDICLDYQQYANDEPHLYIPLLAINPTIESLGYGTSILKHLIEEATVSAGRSLCHDLLFLDVYLSSEKAIKLYDAQGFVRLTPEPIEDPIEGKPFIVMAKRVGIANESGDKP